MVLLRCGDTIRRSPLATDFFTVNSPRQPGQARWQIGALRVVCRLERPALGPI